ncbi:MAG: cell division protein FtsA [Salinibacter sp.]|uniref:cell division protein FtsA n=1 Tax=Salinibacter sp. TaxID=2065818 RepID=UPI0035D5047B
MNDDIVVGVDIGTTKVCAVVAGKDELDRVNVLGVGMAPSDGLNRGVVVNIDRTVSAIREAIEEAERAAGVEVQEVIVGIAGDHVQSFQTRGVVTIRSEEITQNDVQRLLEDTMHVALPADREILHVIPQEFIVDGQDGVADPVGMSGVRLEGDVHIITGLVSAAKNIYRCIEKSGFAVSDLVLEPLASSFSVLHEDEKEVGVALIDVGGGTADIAVFEDNTIRHTAVIAVAGDKVTDDIRKGLGVMRDQAEQLKRQFGMTLAGRADPDEQIEIPGIGGRQEKTIGRDALAQIIQPRMEEILEIAGMEIKRSGYGRHLGVGCVLTGGGALIPGTDELAADVLGMEARIGRPMGLSGGLVEEVSDPKFSTGVGLALYGMRPEIIGGMTLSEEARASRNGTAQGETLMTRIANRMKSWFDEL